jgi:hypothetical protein
VQPELKDKRVAKGVNGKDEAQNAPNESLDPC